MSDFSLNLKRLMNERDLTEQKLADFLGFTRQAVNSYCTSKASPKADTIIKLADYFGVSCDYLLTGVEPADKQESQELGLSGDAIRLFKQCQDERVRGLVDRLLGSPEFYQRAKISFNELTKLDEVKIGDEYYYECILEKFLEKNNGDRNKTAYDFEEFLRMDTRLLTDFISDIMIVDLNNVCEVIDALTEVTEEPQAAPVSLE